VGAFVFLAMPHISSIPSLHAEPAPSVQMRVEVGPRDITIGDPVQLRATVIYSTQVVPVPLNLNSQLGEFELLDYAPTRPQQTTDGKITITHQIVLTTFSTGTQTIPSLSLLFTTPFGAQAEAKTDTIPINVKSVLEAMGDQGGLRPLKGFFDFKSYWWVWLLVALACLGVGGYFGYLWWRSRILEESLRAGPPKPPEEIAWDALHKLEDSNLLSEGHAKEFYFQLSVILRQYLENRYHFSALDRTTSELLMEFRKNNFGLELTNEMRDFLDNADLVKFAKWTPEEGEIDGDVSRVKHVITITTPQTTEPTREAAPL